MTSDEYVCPVCKQAVDTVVRRHKTLGVFVPLWGAGPCQNPQCAEYEEGEAEKAEAESERVLASEPEAPQAAAGQAPADQASAERDS
ncbi:hypothetical protein QFZ24_003652 [Streptomyces phaeochromogenes]|jgi:hypothetical protein|uniref:hypothetical protein n=1 Tax=Streptomyces TaxID=1883 RepID=UPI001180F1BE|nr:MULTISPECIES: hypothetical protein [Streptomyces]MDQ0949729.1 hypothetical protein [Streptomyces phaeochromogenes]TRO64715.1 hypothetical protein E4K73_14660 [Streptomyces sp. IB201691-2A2]